MVKFIIHLTGFGKFGMNEINPTEDVVKKFNKFLEENPFEGPLKNDILLGSCHVMEASAIMSLRGILQIFIDNGLNVPSFEDFYNLTKFPFPHDILNIPIEYMFESLVFFINFILCIRKTNLQL
jgi:hypothetical protein